MPLNRQLPCSSLGVCVGEGGGRREEETARKKEEKKVSRHKANQQPVQFPRVGGRRQNDVHNSLAAMLRASPLSRLL